MALFSVREYSKRDVFVRFSFRTRERESEKRVATAKLAGTHFLPFVYSPSFLLFIYNFNYTDFTVLIHHLSTITFIHLLFFMYNCELKDYVMLI